MSLPSQLALAEIVNGTLADAGPVSNNFSATQTAVNGLINELGPVDNPPCARVFHDAAQAVANQFATVVAFNSERFDTDTIHDNSSNNTRLTCRTAGVYLISGSVAFAPNSTGYRELIIRVNGATVIAAQDADTNTASNHHIVSVATVFKLAVSDYVELLAYQNSGGSLNIEASGDFSPEFSICRLAVG